MFLLTLPAKHHEGYLMKGAHRRPGVTADFDIVLAGSIDITLGDGIYRLGPVTVCLSMASTTRGPLHPRGAR
jgi:hypothetical protein